MEATMRPSLKALLISTAAVATAFAVTPARARDAQEHVLTVALPGGGIEEIHYTGDVVPQVVLAPTQTLNLPSIAPAFGWDPSFAALARISAAFDQEAAAMLQQISIGPAAISIPNLPAGMTGYSVVSTFNSDGACTQSTQITYMGNGVKPRTISSRSGNCGVAHEHDIPADLPVAPPSQMEKHVPHTLEVKATNVKPYTALVREASWHQGEPKTD